MLQDMLELLQHKENVKIAEVSEAIAATSKKFQVEADQYRQSAAMMRDSHHLVRV